MNTSSRPLGAEIYSAAHCMSAGADRRETSLLTEGTSRAVTLPSVVERAGAEMAPSIDDGLYGTMAAMITDGVSPSADAASGSWTGTST